MSTYLMKCLLNRLDTLQINSVKPVRFSYSGRSPGSLIPGLVLILALTYHSDVDISPVDGGFALYQQPLLNISQLVRHHIESIIENGDPLDTLENH